MQSPPRDISCAVYAECNGTETRRGLMNTSKPTRRLQLRHHGSRNGAGSPSISNPSLEPSSPLASTATSTHLSDSENISPLGRKLSRTTSFASTRSPQEVLQEIGNAAWKQSRRVGPKISTGRGSHIHNNGIDASRDDDSTSPPPQLTSGRLRLIRTKGRTNASGRRSASGEVAQYIEHLEIELANAQAQIAEMSSPSVTRQNSNRMRRLNAETRRLQQTVTDWEVKFEQRVQEDTEKHHAAEASLRSRIRDLEQECFEGKLKNEQLESQLDLANQNSEVVETANVGLEKRLEIMSELLAASPTRLDLRLDTPGRPRPARPHSMLPCFPTMGALISVPERSAQTQPTSPAIHIPRNSMLLPDSPDHLALSPDETAFDSEPFFSSDNGSVSVKNGEAGTTSMLRRRQTRRMRRFVAGASGPKPLILPATTHGYQQPQSSTSQSIPSPFEHAQVGAEDHEIAMDTLADMADNGMRSPNESEVPACLMSPMDDTAWTNQFEASNALDSPPSSPGQGFSSLSPKLSSNTGRNLMEELDAANVFSEGESSAKCLSDPTSGHESIGRIAAVLGYSAQPEDSPQQHLSHDIIEEDEDETELAIGSENVIIGLPEPKLMLSANSSSQSLNRSNSPLLSTPSCRSTMSRINDHFRPEASGRPSSLARYLVQLTQSRFRLPGPLMQLQWWFIGFLLGPLARRRMLGSFQSRRSSSSSADGRRRDSLAYGSFDEASPPGSPVSSTRVEILGRIKDLTRTPSGSRELDLDRKRVWKHNPWLWLKFSFTLMVAVSCAIKDGPGSLMLDEGVKGSTQSESQQSRRDKAGHGRITPS